MKYELITDFKDVSQNNQCMNKNITIKYTLDDQEVLPKKKSNSILTEFKYKGGKNVFYLDVKRIKQHVTIILDDIQGIEFNYIDQKDVLTKKYSDFEKGEYLVIIYNMYNNSLKNEILTRHDNLIVLGGSFDFDVEHNRKILAYIKLREL